MADKFKNQVVAVDGPVTNGFVVSPSDIEFAQTTRALYIGEGGDVVVTMAGHKLITGTDITFKNVPAGSILPIRAVKVKATGTTASSIVGLF